MLDFAPGVLSPIPKHPEASTLPHSARLRAPRPRQVERVTDLEKEVARLRRNQVADSLEIDRQKVHACLRGWSGEGPLGAAEDVFGFLAWC